MSLDDSLRKQGYKAFGPFTKSKLSDILPPLIKDYLVDSREITELNIKIIPLSEAKGDMLAPQSLRYVYIRPVKARYHKS